MLQISMQVRIPVDMKLNLYEQMAGQLEVFRMRFALFRWLR